MRQRTLQRRLRGSLAPTARLASARAGDIALVVDDPEPENGADSGANTGADSGADTGGDRGADTSADTGADSGANSGADTGADNGADGASGGSPAPASYLPRSVSSAGGVVKLAHLTHLPAKAQQMFAQLDHDSSGEIVPAEVVAMVAAYETARCDEWRAISQQYTSAYDALRKQCQAGREEQQEAASSRASLFFRRRAKASRSCARRLCSAAVRWQWVAAARNCCNAARRGAAA